MNVVAFVGEITEIPTVKESVNGNKYATLTIQVPRSFMNSEGVYEKDEVSFMLWKGIAETVANVAKVNDSVAVKGRLQTRFYEGNDGGRYKSYDLIAEQVSFIRK